MKIVSSRHWADGRKNRPHAGSWNWWEFAILLLGGIALGFALFMPAKLHGEEAPKAVTTTPSLALTELERASLENVKLKQANLQMEYDKIMARAEAIKNIYPQMLQAEQALVEAAAKAHGVDLKTHRLSPDGTAFEPLPTRAEAKK